MTRLRKFTLLSLLTTLTACAQTGTTPDPLEDINRQVFAFNQFADRVAIKPTAEAYRAIVPELLRSGINNFFDNASYPVTFVNQYLQGKPGRGTRDVGRFLVNTTLGMAGLIDVASPMGLEQHSEDFGQTFAVWGIDSGPYLVVPFLGSYTLRGGIGAIADRQGRLRTHIEDDTVSNSMLALFIIQQRASLLGMQELVQGGDPYLFARSSFLQRREFAISDGETSAGGFPSD